MMHWQSAGRSVTTRRSGYALVLFVMLLFGMFALAALVIDLGFARLAQRQMQSQVDATAIHGLSTGLQDGVDADDRPFLLATDEQQIELTFGQGSLIQGDLRANGITVRAESFAVARPAVTVGVARAEFDLPGALPLAFTSEGWASLVENSDGMAGELEEVELTVATSGELQVDGEMVGIATSEQGLSQLSRVGDVVLKVELQEPTPAEFVEQVKTLLVPNAIADVDAPSETEHRFGYVSIVNSESLVIGFGYLEFSTDEIEETDADTFRVRPQVNRVANANAMAVFGPGVLKSSVAVSLLAQQAEIEGPLLAPVLTRSPQ